MKEITIAEGLYKSLCGLVTVALKVEGFDMGLQPTEPGEELVIDEDNYYLSHSLDARLKIKVPTNRIEWDVEHTERNHGNVHNLVARGETVVSYNGVTIAKWKDLGLSNTDHASLWGMYDLILKWYHSKKLPSYMDGTKKDQWESIVSSMCDDPDYRMGEMMASGSPMILETIGAYFPSRSKKALAYYRKYSKKPILPTEEE